MGSQYRNSQWNQQGGDTPRDFEPSRDRYEPFGLQYGSSPTTWSQASGAHVGKGPKGYRRSDERIKEEVSEVLERHPHIDASEIEIDVNGGVRPESPAL